MDETLLWRVKTRLDGSDMPGDDVLRECMQGVTDRLKLMVRADVLPSPADSIVVDATVKAVNRRFYEGISSESEGQTGSVTTAFFENILAEYADEVQGLREMVAATGGGVSAKVRFI